MLSYGLVKSVMHSENTKLSHITILVSTHFLPGPPSRIKEKIWGGQLKFFTVVPLGTQGPRGPGPMMLGVGESTLAACFL